MSVELLTATEEFDQNPEREKWEPEKKYVLKDPHFFDFLLDLHEPIAIEQLYLSESHSGAADAESSLTKPSLRLRKTVHPSGEVRYSATLKAEGRMVPHGLMRRETPTAISQEAYEFYAGQDFSRLHKLRVEPFPGVSVDWIEGYDSPIVELEELGIHPEAVLFLQQYQDAMVEKTGQNLVNNEWIAHHLSRSEQLPAKPLTVEKMSHDIMGYRHYGVRPIVVTIDGRSGSGKSTVANQLVYNLHNTHRVGSVLLSTDDYHRGKTWLEAYNNGQPWENWDDPIVYDTQQLAKDMAELRAGNTIPRRHFSFATQEVVIDGEISPADVVIVEGIHGGTKDLEGIRHFHYSVPTSLAVAIYRDLARIRSSDRPNSTLGSPEERLRYQLEVAEPSFQAINRIHKKDLRKYRTMLGKQVLQMRDGRVVQPIRSKARRTPELPDSAGHR